MVPIESWIIPTIIALIGLIGGVIGYLLRYFLDKKKELVSENRKITRRLYQEFVNRVIELFKSVKETKEYDDGVAMNQMVDGIYEFYKKYLLYASPKLVRALGDFMQFNYIKTTKDPKEIMRLLSRVIKTMRSELGLSNKGLGEDGEEIFRAQFKDFDKFYSTKVN